jgi:hypothetical protein
MVAMSLFYLGTAVCRKVTWSPCSYFASVREQLTAEKLHGRHVLILPRLLNSWLQKSLHGHHVLILPRLVNRWLQKRLRSQFSYFTSSSEQLTAEKVTWSPCSYFTSISEQLTAEKVAMSPCSYFTPISEQLTPEKLHGGHFLLWCTADCRKVKWSPCSYFTKIGEQLSAVMLHVRHVLILPRLGNSWFKKGFMFAMFLFYLDWRTSDKERMSWRDGFHVLSFTLIDLHLTSGKVTWSPCY